MDEFLLEQDAGFDGGGYYELPCCEAVPSGYIPDPVYIAPEPIYVPPPEPVYVAPIEPIYQEAFYQEPIYQAPEPIYFESEPQFFELPYVEPMPVYQEPIAYVEPFSPIAAPISDQFVYVEPEPIFEEQFFGLPYEGFESEPVFEPAPIYQEPISFIQISPELGISTDAFLIEQPSYVEPIFEPAPVFEPVIAEETFFALPVPPEPEPVPIAAPAPAIASILPGYVGCFIDTNSRDLSYWAPISGPLTVEQCKATCIAAGYQYAGLQYSGECFCGDSYGRYGPAGNCNMPCSGDPNQICGGTWANSVYALPIAPELEPVIEEQFFALPEPPPPAPMFVAESEAFIAPVAPESPPENFFRCRPCTDGGASGLNGWGGAYGDGFLY